MLGLGRKKHKDEEEEELSAEEVKKDLKDLKSKNKKQRKEPPRPWNKKDRILVLFFLFGTSIIAGLLALSSRSWKLPNLPRIVTPEISLDGTYVLEATETQGGEAQSIKQQFTDMTKSLSGVYGLYVYRVNEQTSYGVFEDEQFSDPAFIDLLTRVTSYHALEEGDIRSNELSNYAPLVQHIQSFAEEAGLSSTQVSAQLTTPSDVGKFYAKLLDGRLINRKHTSEVLDSLRKEHFIGSTDAALLSYTDTQVMTQSGVLYFDRQPVVVVLTGKGIISSEAAPAFPVLLRMVYDYEI